MIPIPAREARLRMSSLASAILATTDPAVRADLRTSMTDARTALCIARGVPLDDIHPGTGHDLSFPAYERVRQSWLRLIADDGGWTDWSRPRCVAAGERWRRHRPEYLDKLPWPQDGDEA